MAEHTPRPWHYDPKRIFSIRDESNNPIAQVSTQINFGHGNVRDPKSLEANALLIAAAPDMFAALDEYVAEWARDGFFYGKDIRAPYSFTLARQIMAKAKGKE